MSGGERAEGGGRSGLRPSSPTPSLNRVLLTACAKQVHTHSPLLILLDVFLQTAFPLHRAQSVLLPTGWHGATHLQESATSPVCKLLKKERKETKEEEEDEILSKLQRDDVSASCFVPVKL